jgi:cysteinyl-tRNA synthetase
MSGKLLGFPFDIHTGGIDHREIHHPNEIAQNQAFCCAGSLTDPANSGARVWMHNNFLVERSGKMSKSSGEFLRLQLLIDKGYHPLAYRLLCLQAHYRSELEFSWDGLGAALTRLKRMVMAVAQLKERAEPGADTSGWRSHAKLAPLVERFDAAISDDLNTAVALTVLDEVIALKKIDPALKLAAIAALDGVLGLNLMGLSRRPAPAAQGGDDHRGRDRPRHHRPPGSPRRQGLRPKRHPARRTGRTGRGRDGRRSAGLGLAVGVTVSPPL